MQQIAEKLNQVIWVQHFEESPGELLIHQEAEKMLLRMAKCEARIPRLITIKGKKGSGKRFLMTHLSFRLKKWLVMSEMEPLYQCCMEEGTQILRVLSCILKENQAQMCLMAGGRESGEDIGETNRHWRELLYGMVLENISVYILTDRSISLPQDGNYVQAGIELLSPNVEMRIELWKHFLSKHPGTAGLSAEFLAGKYMLNAGRIQHILATASLYREGTGREDMAESDIAKAVKLYEHENFGAFASYVPSVYTWEDLIVSEEVRRKLVFLCSQVKYKKVVGSEWGFFAKKAYGRGVSALFYGPSGTGKTMAARIIANDLGLSLYRVDLSQMTSKYIGETQKNISGLFEKAAEMNVVLLFDEADSFFSKRTGVKDSHDRHSNGEVAHLLQKMEDYEGVAILTTNLKDNMDDAFKRRIKVMIEFELPEADARKRLWEQALPQKAPVEADVELTIYAQRFELSGSEIQETMLNAAFLAASEEKRIGRSHIEEALRNTCLKYGRVLLREELEY